MEMKEVVSSNIHSVGFELSEVTLGDLSKEKLKTGTLQVRFIGGGLYRYFGVSQEMFEALMAAPSKGKYLNANVARKFKYERVVEEQKPPIEKKLDTEAPKEGVV